jgi:hypothetical protein
MREMLISVFPGLADDPNFKIESKQTPDYNCIAWAAIYDDRWVWPVEDADNIEGRFYWPEGVRKDESPEAFIGLFESMGYHLCEDGRYEHGYRKVAVYIDPNNGKVTHAARQRTSGLWTSKLGENHDIIHTTPESLESSPYGKVSIFLRKKV